MINADKYIFWGGEEQEKEEQHWSSLKILFYVKVIFKIKHSEGL